MENSDLIKLFKGVAVAMIVVILFFLALILTSCKKCAECTTTVTQTASTMPPVIGTSTTEMCGDELDEADGYTSTSTGTYQGHTVTIKTVTDCK